MNDIFVHVFLLLYFGSNFRDLNGFIFTPPPPLLLQTLLSQSYLKLRGGFKRNIWGRIESFRLHQSPMRLPKLWCKLDIEPLRDHYRHTHLPRACLHIWFTAYISPLVSEKILDEKHQTGFRSMVHSYHIPDTLSDKDVPVVTTTEDNLPKYKLLFKITLNLLKMLFYLSNNKFMQWELACE